MNFIETMGFKVYNDFLSNIVKRNKLIVINTISPNSYGISTKDCFFREALIDSDYLVLDGVYFALASILINKSTIKKNQGPEVFKYFMNKTNIEKGKIFFLGANDLTLQKIEKRANTEYPNIIVKTYSPPFKNEFNSYDNAAIIDAVNIFKPDVLFVGMTCPKQEKWVHQHKNKINASYAISIGGVFDWYAGNHKELSPLWWKLNLGWLGRAIQRPALLKRNMPGYYIFLKDMIKYYIKK